MTAEESRQLAAEAFDAESAIPLANRDLYMLKACHPELKGVPNILSVLIKDRSANLPIFFGTDNYLDRSDRFEEDARMKAWQMREMLIDDENALFQPRSEKEQAIQSKRTKKRGEVLTPLWIVNQMIDVLEEEWKELSLDQYLKTTVLEICCGEAPFLVQRYDPISGEYLPVEKRNGIIDRKLKRISQQTSNRKTWMRLTYAAYRSVYGYEYQGDSLFLGRENLLFGFIEHYWDKWQELPTLSEISKIASIISWNLFQMDGLKKETLRNLQNEPHQTTLFDTAYNPAPIVTLWEGRGSSPDEEYRKYYGDEGMKFDVVIGNPAYQENYKGDSNGANPIYHLFIDEARKIADKGMLIHPARFLSNVGKTPKPWNQKMLHDQHFKIVDYWADSTQIFNGVDIKGGVVVSYWDQNQNFGEIGVFIPYKEMRSVLSKVNEQGYKPLSSSISPVGSYRLDESLYEDNPWANDRPSKGHRYDVTSNVFTVFPELFFDDCPEDSNEYIQIYGREKNTRKAKWINKKYIKAPSSIDGYRVIITKANGSGTFGEILSSPEILSPNIGHTFTFLSIGPFETEDEAKNLRKYLSTKFARAMLGTLKVTQDNLQGTWSNVPLQDFTSSSDIDWSKSIKEIDQQLYRKYVLSDEEISFIENNVKEMA